ncbi:MAG: sigma-70 family RNA polymerase sigma factor [Planctomycetota bacterium]
MLSNTADVVLVSRAQANEKSAYEELIHRHSRLVWSVVYGIVRDTAWTEAVVQETFLKGWQAISSLRETANFRAWLVTIAKNNAFRHNSANARREEVLSDVAYEAAKNAGAVNQDAESLRQQLHKALTEMPEQYRVPITLRYLEGMSYNEIAETLGLTDGSLRGLLSRGIKLLKETVKIN